jgi:hypothetical protein
MPDKKILIAGGQKEEQNDTSPVNQWGYMKRSDLYHPETDTWRKLADLNYFREYHTIMTLVPDGRVIAVGGEGQPGNEPTQSIIEGYKPPYLFRGVRPEIMNLNVKRFSKGDELAFEIARTDSITGLLLMANAVNTHFMNSSSNRFIELEYEQTNGKVTALLPSDSLILFDGFYMLFAMVDDIPSIAEIIVVNNQQGMTSNITEYEKEDVVIYPNPCKDIVYFKSGKTILGVTIRDSNGRIVVAKRGKNIESVNLGGYPSGIYYIEVMYDNNEAIIQKISKI